MTLSFNLLGYSDLGLFLAVVGIYVFFAALWLVYSVTEKNARAAKDSDESIEALRRESMLELTRSEIENAVHEAIASEAALGHSADTSGIKNEVATVREIAVLSGNRVRALAQENDELKQRVDALESALNSQTTSPEAATEVEETKVEPTPVSTPLRDSVSIEMTRVSVSEPTEEEATETQLPELRIYNPVVNIGAEELASDSEAEPVPSFVPEELHGIEPEVLAAACMDDEKGLVFYCRPSQPDDLTRIWGVGSTNQDLLNENGVFYFGQIAHWSDETIERFNNILCFRGRIEREDWVGQAKRLVAAEQYARNLHRAA